MSALVAQNQNIPQGLIIRKEGQYIFKTEGQVRTPDELNNLVIGKFEISYTQKDLIKLSVDNMLEALLDAIIITVLVIFLFLGNIRTMLLCAISIPFTYLITFAFMWLFDFEFHMVTLTGVILAAGMLLDDAIVVIENIERHYHESGKDIEDIVAGSTEEVMLAIFSGLSSLFPLFLSAAMYRPS